jgi:hypothetical protein
MQIGEGPRQRDANEDRPVGREVLSGFAERAYGMVHLLQRVVEHHQREVALGIAEFRSPEANCSEVEIRGDVRVEGPHLTEAMPRHLEHEMASPEPTSAMRDDKSKPSPQFISSTTGTLACRRDDPPPRRAAGRAPRPTAQHLGSG